VTAYQDGLPPELRAWLRKRNLQPVVGHAGFAPIFFQAHPVPGVRGSFVLQVHARAFGLSDVAFYVYWDFETKTFVQGSQM
jgi:hypothetical protein